MLPIRIKDENGQSVQSVQLNGQRGLLVGSFKARELLFHEKRFLNSSGSANMVINGSLGGTATVVWNGTGSSDVGGDWTVSGTSPFVESAAAMRTGTNGLDTGIAANGDKLLFTDVAQPLSSFVALTFWVNTQSSGADSDIELQWQLEGASTGNNLNLIDYIISFTLSNWIKVTIPLVDFNVVGNVDALEFKFRKSDQQHYIDDVELGSIGGTSIGPTVFRVTAPPGQRFMVDVLRIVIVDAQSGWVTGDFATINGGLASGLLIRYWDHAEGEVFFSDNISNNTDLFGLFDNINSVGFFDSGRLLTFVLPLIHPIELRDTIVIDIVIRDDLSSLLRLQARAVGGCRGKWENIDGEIVSEISHD